MGDWLNDKASELWDWFTSIGVNLLTAGIVIAAILLGSGWLRRRVNRGFRRRQINRNVVDLIDILAKIIAYIFIFLVLLRAFGVQSSSLATSVGLVVGAITLALQDVLKNLVSGVYLLIEQPFRVGDHIEVTGQKGTVEKVDIRTTVLRNEFDEQVLVPNYKVFSEIVLNRTANVDAPDHYSIAGTTTQPSAMKEIVAKIAANLPLAKPPVLDIVSAGPDHFDYEIRLWWKAGSADRFTLVSLLRERFPDATIIRKDG
jgi:small-conductance mechanosensitive channel